MFKQKTPRVSPLAHGASGTSVGEVQGKGKKGFPFGKPFLFYLPLS